MREPTFLVLAALADGPKHGYAVIKAAEAVSEGRVRLQTGTLYATLDRLAKEQLVAAAGQETVDGRSRQYWALTDAGAAALSAEVQRLQVRTRQAASRLRLRVVAA